MINIYIPSKSRSDIFDSQKKTSTFNAFYGLGYKIHVVVYPDEYMEYKMSARKHKKNVNLITCEGGKGIAFKRWFIGQHAKDNNIDKFIMCDDDLRFFYRKNGRLVISGKSHMKQMVEELISDLDNYPMVGISSRGGNNRIEGDYIENNRLIQLQACRVKEFNSIEHQRIMFMEDFDIILQMLKRGWPNKIYYKWAKNDVSQSAGGCSDYRTVKNQSECAERLAELHPDCVRVVQKENKGAYGKRKDVVIQWKKAYEIGAKNNG